MHKYRKLALDTPWKKRAAIATVVIAGLAVLQFLSSFNGIRIWGNFIRPWLASQIETEILANGDTAWFGKQLYTYLETSEPELLQLLQSSEEMQPVFLAHLKQAQQVKEIERFVIEQVDAVYVLELYDKRQLQLFDGSGGLQLVKTSQLSSQFYASKDQVINMNARPIDYGRDWNAAIRENKNNVVLQVGTERFPVGQHGLEEDITCDVRQQLRTRPAGVITVTAHPENGEFFKDGSKEDEFEIQVTIVAAKGERDCQT